MRFGSLLCAAMSLLALAPASAQRPPDGAPPSVETADPAVRAHIDAARSAAGARWADRVTAWCNLAAPVRSEGPPDRPAPITMPETPNWPEAPAMIFDNLYFVGSKGVSAFAIDTRDGIIITDAMWAYDIERSVVGGLRALGLDPKRIRYVIIPHGHPDHYGGAQFMHDAFGAKIVAPRGDLDLIAKGPSYDTTPIPKGYDLLIGDGDTLTLGGTTIAFTVMPGHTPGGVVMTFPVTNRGKRHRILIWSAGSATPANPTAQALQAAALKTLIARARRGGVDALADNHGSHVLVETLRARPEGGNPFLVGRDALAGYLTTRMECDLARSLSSARPLVSAIWRE